MRLNLVTRAVLVLLALAVIGAVSVPLWLTPLVAGRVRSAASSRSLQASWSELRVSWPATVNGRDLVLLSAKGDTVLVARRFEAKPRMWSLFRLRPTIASASLDGARIQLGTGGGDEDTLAVIDAELDDPRAGGDVAPRIRNLAEQLTRSLLLPARRLPELQLTNVVLQRGDSSGVALDALSLSHRTGALELALTGLLLRDQGIPFDAQLRWAPDDRLTGRAEFRIPEDGRTEPVPIVFTMDGQVHQDRAGGQLRIEPNTRVTVGEMAMRLDGHTDTHGPAFHLNIAMDSLTAASVQRSLPRAMLGPLTALSVYDSLDWHASFAVGVANRLEMAVQVGRVILQVAIVGKHPVAAPQFAHKGVGVFQGDLAHCGFAHMRHHVVAFNGVVFEHLRNR